jgi:hypothetical protein
MPLKAQLRINRRHTHPIVCYLDARFAPVFCPDANLRRLGINAIF